MIPLFSSTNQSKTIIRKSRYSQLIIIFSIIILYYLRLSKAVYLIHIRKLLNTGGFWLNNYKSRRYLTLGLYSPRIISNILCKNSPSVFRFFPSVMATVFFVAVLDSYSFSASSNSAISIQFLMFVIMF